MCNFYDFLITYTYFCQEYQDSTTPHSTNKSYLLTYGYPFGPSYPSTLFCHLTHKLGHHTCDTNYQIALWEGVQKCRATGMQHQLERAESTDYNMRELLANLNTALDMKPHKTLGVGATSMFCVFRSNTESKIILVS